MPTTGRKLASRAAAILIIIAAAIVLLERAPFLTIWFLDDKDAPDARIVHAAFAKAGTANERELRLDLSAINSGAWQCSVWSVDMNIQRARRAPTLKGMASRSSCFQEFGRGCG
jgi:hypothetical protein